MALPRLCTRTLLARSWAPIVHKSSKSLFSTSTAFATRSAPPSSPFASLLSRFASPAAPKRTLATAAIPVGETTDWAAIGKRFGIAAVGALALNLALNRETRAPLSAGESSLLHETFMWTGAGLAITGTVIKLLHSSAGASRIMALNPWVFAGASLVLSIGSMMTVFNTAPDSPLHYASWALFSAVQGATLSPMFFLAPAILARAGLYTGAALGGLTFVGVTAQNETYLYMGGFLMAGLGVVLISSLAPMLMPRMAKGTMSMFEHVSAYGGVAVFSGLILYDTQKVLSHALLVEQGQMRRDPVRESVSIILDVINLFVRIVQVLALQQRKK